MDQLDRDMMRSDPVLRCYLAGIPLNDRFRVGKWFWLLWLLVVPLILGAIFWRITCAESRFWSGSLNQQIPHSGGDVSVGLGFLDDSAVWPFFLLVPLLLVLLRRAIGKTIVLYRARTTLVRPQVLADAAWRQRFDAVVAEAVEGLRYRGGWWRTLWLGAILLGLLLLGFNTATCFRADAWPIAAIPYDQLWSWLKPYGPQPALIKPGTVVITLKDPASFVTPCKDASQLICLPPALADQKLTISTDRRRVAWSGPLSRDEQRALAALWPGAEWQQAVQSLARQKSEGYVSNLVMPFDKWDTDKLGAPTSWWAIRTWALLFGYAILPVALLRVLNLVHVVWRFTKSLAKQEMLKANPYSAESRASLKLIVSALFAANYCLLVASLMVVSLLLKVGAKPGWHDLAALLVFLPLFAFAALAPMLSISGIFERRVKRGYLAVHAGAAATMHQAFRDGTAYMDADDAGGFADTLSKYDEYLSRGQDTAIFPISWTTITNTAAPVTPLVLALGEKLVGLLF